MFLSVFFPIVCQRKKFALYTSSEMIDLRKDKEELLSVINVIRDSIPLIMPKGQWLNLTSLYDQFLYILV